jgi:hypothetical protein
VVQVAAGGGPGAARRGAPTVTGPDQVLESAAGVIAGLGAGVVAGAAGDRDQRDVRDVRAVRESGGPVPGGLGSRAAAERAGPGGGCRPGRQPWAAAVPSGLTTVRHQRVRGWRAAAAARSRASSASSGPNPSASPGASERRCHVAGGW